MNGPYATQRRGRLRDFFAGAGYLGRGLGWTLRNPGQWLFGLVPALVALVLYGSALLALGWYAGDLAKTITPFADHWSQGIRQTLRVLTSLSLFGAGAFVAAVTYTGTVLAIGTPFYEKLAEQVDGRLPGARQSLPAQFLRGIGDTIVLGLAATAFAVLFFALGFIPVIGQTVVPVLAATVTGYFLTGELTAIALERRGLARRERFLLLKANRSLAVGFGAATVVLFMIPLGAVVVMPGAIVGATLLARERLVA